MKTIDIKYYYDARFMNKQKTEFMLTTTLDVYRPLVELKHDESVLINLWGYHKCIIAKLRSIIPDPIAADKIICYFEDACYICRNDDCAFETKGDSTIWKY